jgi:hypothetical protein
MKCTCMGALASPSYLYVFELEKTFERKNKVNMCTFGVLTFNFSLIHMCFDIGEMEESFKPFLIHQDHSRSVR